MSDFGDIYSQRHEDNRIFFSANETNLQQFSHDLPSTSVPDRLFVVVEVYHRIRPDRPPSGGVPAVEYGISRREFSHPLERFASAEAAKPAVEAMLSEIELPFRLDGDESRTQLRWKEGDGDGDDVSDASSVRLDGVGAAVARVSEVGARIVASGRGAPLEMRVTIRKVTVVSAEPYGAMFEGYGELNDETQMFIEEVEEAEEQVRDLSSAAAAAEEQLGDLTERLSPVEAAAEEQLRVLTERLPSVAEAAAEEQIRNLTERLSSVAEEQLRVSSERLWSVAEAAEEWVPMTFDSNNNLLRFGLVVETEAERQPSAAAAATEALETVVYEGGGGEANKLTCPICIDDVAIGSHVTRLNCSHRFHRDCIDKWLEKSRTCPLCRSNW